MRIQGAGPGEDEYLAAAQGGDAEMSTRKLIDV